MDCTPGQGKSLVGLLRQFPRILFLGSITSKLLFKTGRLVVPRNDFCGADEYLHYLRSGRCGTHNQPTERTPALLAVAIGETRTHSNHERQGECRFDHATVVLR